MITKSKAGERYQSNRRQTRKLPGTILSVVLASSLLFTMSPGVAYASLRTTGRPISKRDQEPSRATVSLADA